MLNRYMACRAFARGRLLGTVFVVGCASVVLAAQAGAAVHGSKSSASRTITIGELGTFSGPNANPCVDERAGAETAIKKYSGSSYLRGVRLKLDAQDDQGTAAQGLIGYQAIESSSADAMIGPCGSQVEAAYQYEPTKAKFPDVITSAGDLAVTDSKKTAYNFGSTPSLLSFSADVLPVLKTRGVKKVFMIYESDIPTTLDLYQTVFAKGLAANGMTQVGSDSVTLSTTDFSAIVAHIEQSGAQAIGLDVATPLVLPALTQIRGAGITVPVFGHNGFSVPSIINSPEAHNLLFATTFDVDALKGNAIGQAFAKAYKKTYGRVADFTAAVAFDATQRVIEAIHAVGVLKVANSSRSAARQLIYHALNAQKTETGVQGKLKFVKHVARFRSPPAIIDITSSGAITEP